MMKMMKMMNMVIMIDMINNGGLSMFNTHKGNLDIENVKLEYSS